MEINFYLPGTEELLFDSILRTLAVDHECVSQQGTISDFLDVCKKSFMWRDSVHIY